MSDENKVVFVLTGAREGHTGILGGRYGFVNGELTVEHSMREPVRMILCNSYACNIRGEAPLWKTVESDGKNGKKVKGSVKVTDVEKPKKETTTVKTAPEHSTTGEGVKVELKASVKE